MFKICALWTVILWYELNPRVRCAFGNVFIQKRRKNRFNSQQITSKWSAFKDRDFRLSRLELVGINLRADGESFETETWNKVPRFPHILLTAKSARDYRNFKTFTFKKVEYKTCFAPWWALPEGWVDEAIWPKHGRVGPFDQNMTTGIWTDLLFKRPNPTLSHKLRKGAFREVVDSLRDILESQADHFGKALSWYASLWIPPVVVRKPFPKIM